MRHPLWDTLPRWLLTWLVCVALNLGLMELLKVDSRWWLAALVLLLWCGALGAAEFFGRFWAMLALWAAALGLCLLLSDWGLLTEAALATFSRAETADGYGELVLLLLCAAAVLPLSALLRSYWMRAALSLGWTALWITAALLEWPLPRLVPAALIPLLLLTLTETIRRTRREEEPDKPFKRALLLSLLPMALLLSLLPAPEEPYGYPLLHAVADRVEQLWHDAETSLRYRHRGDEEFGMSFNGVSDEAEVGKGNREDGAGVLYAYPGQEPDGAVYLFGNAWNRFDGRGWSSTLKPEDAELLNWSLDTTEHVYALWRLLGERSEAAEFSDYFRTNNVYLSSRNLDMRTMFTVMNTTHIQTDEERFPYADAPTGSLFDYVQREDVWYRVYYLESNVRTRGELIASAEGTVYDTEEIGPRWRWVAEDLPGSLQLELRDNLKPEEVFAKREALIRNVYLDCTGVSDRAAALAEEITAGCGRDSEKLAAIAAYLQANYTYTLQPAPVPAGGNFLDWLLFESREGYCAWYATAAVLLARSVGVPARYVQGYRGELAADMFTALLPGDAHAWCEGYITGYGWLTVEATPGFSSDGAGWLTAAEERAQRGGETGTAGEGAGRGNGGERDKNLVILVPPTHQIDAVQQPLSEPEQEDQPASPGWLPPLIFAVLVAALLTVWMWQRARRKRRYAEADPAEKLLLDLESLLRDLRGKGYPRHPEEPLRLYFARLPWHYLLTSEEEAAEMAALYDRTFFAQTPPSEAEFERHRAFAARFRPRTLRQWMIWYRLQ